MKQLSGLDAAFLTLETNKLSVSECVDRIVGLLERRKLA